MKNLLLIFCLTLALPSFARKWNVELGINYPVSIHRDGSFHSKFSLFAQGSHQLASPAWDVDLRLSLESYASTTGIIYYPNTIINGQPLAFYNCICILFYFNDLHSKR